MEIERIEEKGKLPIDPAAIPPSLPAIEGKLLTGEGDEE